MDDVRILFKVPGDSPLADAVRPLRNRSATAPDALVFYLAATGRLSAVPAVMGTGEPPHGGPAQPPTEPRAAGVPGPAHDAATGSDADWARRVGGFDLGGLGGA